VQRKLLFRSKARKPGVQEGQVSEIGSAQTLDRHEAIAILEEIARDGRNAAARIAAIRMLRQMEGEPDDHPTPFDHLDVLTFGRARK
jgi:hypothetical protein